MSLMGSLVDVIKNKRMRDIKYRPIEVTKIVPFSDMEKMENLVWSS